MRRGWTASGDSMETPSTLADDKDLFPRHLGRKLVPVVVVAIAAYLALFLLADADVTVREMSRVSGRAIVFACLLSLASFFLRAVRWHALLRRVRSNRSEEHTSELQ